LTVRTYAMTLPDQVGAMLEAGRIFSSLGMNMTRVSYNKSVDLMTIFIDAEGTAEAHRRAETLLREGGYLNRTSPGDVKLLRLTMHDGPGQMNRALEIVRSFGVNISYISYIQSEGDTQSFRLGLFITEKTDYQKLLSELSTVAKTEELYYDESDFNYDNTVFYSSFVRNICQELSLSEEDSSLVLSYANMIMQNLDETGLPAYEAFSNISKISNLISSNRHEKFDPRISYHDLSKDTTMILIEPPCGSNTMILKGKDGYLFIDCGLAVYREEMLSLFRKFIPEWDDMPKRILITHSDLDHCGLLDEFDEVILNSNSAESLITEFDGRDCFREQNPVSRPYIKLYKLMTGYRPPDPGKLNIMFKNPRGQEEIFRKIGTFDFSDLHFHVYEGMGGHVVGEMVFIDYTNRIAFTGDIYVNIKEMTKVQAEYNRCAPVLMTSVDTDPRLCAYERSMIFRELPEGQWKVFGSHGPVYDYVSTEE